MDDHDPVTLDLNRPEDAQAYILTWTEDGTEFVGCTDEDYLRVAKQLFLYCDPRPALGPSEGHH